MNVLATQKDETGTLLDNKITDQATLDGGLKLKVMRNGTSDRIFVEFSSPDGKLVVQKTFQDNLSGRQLADAFKGTYKSLSDLQNHFKQKIGDVVARSPSKKTDKKRN